MYLYFLFYTTMSECMIFYGPTVPEINFFYSSSSSTLKVHFKKNKRLHKLINIAKKINVFKCGFIAILNKNMALVC